MPDPYQVYVLTYGKVKSGKVLDNNEYYYPTDEVAGMAEYDERCKVAVSLAVQDVKNNEDLRSKSAFNEELTRLIG